MTTISLGLGQHCVEVLVAGAFLWRSHIVGKYAYMGPSLAVVLLDHELRATIHSC